MPDNRRQSDLSFKRACLAFFLKDRLIPSLQRVEMRSTRSFVFAELLESFLWLHHGVEIDYFPMAESRRVMYEYFEFFLKAHHEVSSGPYFETWFTPPLRAMLSSEFTGNLELFSSGRIWQSSSVALPKMHELFQSFFVLANGFAQNPKARPLLQALATVNDSTWQNVIAHNERVLDVEQPAFEPLRDVAIPNWTHSGFFAAVDYMQAFRRLTLDVGQVHPDMGNEMEHYIRSLKETQQWRLNFGYPRERERFVQTGRIAAEAFVEHLPEADGFDQKTAVERFIKELLELMTDWGAPIYKAAGA
jgi:hypothetical protein